MGEEENSVKPPWYQEPRWCRVVETAVPFVPKAPVRISILDAHKELGEVLSDGAKTEIKALESQSADWETGLADSVYGIVCADLSGHNRNVPERDTRVLPKDFSYNKVRLFYIGEMH